VIQLTAGFAVAIGLATRSAAVLGSGSMAYAYFSVHQEKALLPIQNGGEPAVMFCWALLLIAATGPGRFSADRLLRVEGSPSLQQEPSEIVNVPAR
jgi:putative oxidoreductase